MRCLVIAAACWFALISGATADNAKEDPSVSARNKYAKHPPDALKIVEPVKIARVLNFKDGGTAGLKLIDAKDKKHAFSLYPPDGAGLPVKGEKPKIIPNLFVGATYPTDPNAKRVDIRGPEESALYGVLLRTVDKHKEREAILAKNINEQLWEARKLWGTDLFELHTFFHRLESHFLRE